MAQDKRYISAGGRSGAMVLDPEREPKIFRDTVKSFLDVQRARVKELTAGNIRLIDVGALVPPRARELANTLAERMIREALGRNDLIVPCGDDGFVLLFSADTVRRADEITRRVSEEISRALSGQPETKGFTAKAFTFDLNKYVDKTLIDTVDDLKKVVKQAYQEHVQALKAGMRRASDIDKVRFTPVIAAGKKLLVGYRVHLFLDKDGTMEEADPLNGPSAAERGELAALMMERLAYYFTVKEGAVENLLLYLLLPPDLFDNPLYFDNFEHELFGLPPEARRRLVFVVDIANATRPLATARTAAEKLQGRGRAMVAMVPPRVRDIMELQSMGIAGLSPHPRMVRDRETAKGFVKEAAAAELRTFWFEGDIPLSPADIILSGFEYFCVPSQTRPVDAPGSHYKV